MNWNLVIDIALWSLLLGVPALYILVYKNRTRRARALLEESQRTGRDQPVSIHPLIDYDKCIGSGACVAACPEKNVIGLIRNKGVLVNPTHCIGHGLCEAACPVGAITLVFGTEKRGVDLPNLDGKFQTNVPGIYIAGELGGMGLIRNAMTQGRQAAEYIADSLKGKRERQTPREGRLHDLFIVGAGPAGIGAALQAEQMGLDYLMVDMEKVGGAIQFYPRNKVVMLHKLEIPTYGKVKNKSMQKEEILTLLQDLATRNDLKVNPGESVIEISQREGIFEIETTLNRYWSRKVLLAIGRMGTPRRLNVPGEACGKVFYRLLEPEQFGSHKNLVVGGGDSAVEAALALAGEPGGEVHLSYRGDSFFRIKTDNLHLLEAAIAAGKIKPLLNSTVSSIEPDQVILDQGGQTITIPNDYIFAFLGGELPISFLKRVGLEFTTKYGEK